MKMNNASTIIAVVDHSFDVILESMVGSTGYGWCLKSLPDGVELISTTNVPVRQGVAPVRQIFTFAALKPIKKGVLKFDLLCLHTLSRDIADHATYNVEIHDKKENDELANEIGGQKFLKGAGAMLHAGPAMPYGFPDSDKTALLLYGFPNADASCAASVIYSNANCLLKYGTPFGVSTDDSGCNLKYGFPVTPVIYKYGFPLTNASGGDIQVEEDANNCIVKYGTPGGVGTDQDCALKYGFPSIKYGFPSNK